MQVSEKKEIFPKNKTYSLMGLVEGDSFRVERDPENTVMSYPHLVVRELLLFLVVFIVVLVVSMIFNAPLEEPANALHSTNPAKAPWYFVGIQELVSYSAFLGGIVAPGLIVLSLFALPYLDRNPRGVGVWFSGTRKFGIAAFSLFVIVMVVLILIGEFLRGPNWNIYWPWM